jgi:Family of unknown function (DUF6174)
MNAAESSDVHSKQESGTEDSSPQTQVQWQRASLNWILVPVTVVFAAIIFYRIFWGDNTPSLTRKIWESQQKTWNESQIQNYTLQVRVNKLVPEIFEVEVFNGKATAVKLNGLAITEPRVMDTWSVPGMFITLDDDLAHGELLATGAGNKNTPHLRLWCQFNKSGVPLRYRRLDWQKGEDLLIEVIAFEKLAQ